MIFADLCELSTAFYSFLLRDTFLSFKTIASHSRMKIICLIFALVSLVFLRADAQCPCICMKKPHESFGMCKRLAFNCKVVGCMPRTIGYSCCNSMSMPRAAPTLLEAKAGLTTIDSISKAAVEETPFWTNRLALVLLRCRNDINQVGRMVPGTDRQASQNGRARRAYPTFRNTAGRTLEYLYAQLVKHIH